MLLTQFFFFKWTTGQKREAHVLKLHKKLHTEISERIWIDWKSELKQSCLIIYGYSHLFVGLPIIILPEATV